jgi:hypothetical protein
MKEKKEKEKRRRRRRNRALLPKTRWEDDVLEDIRSINIGNWKKVARNRDSWKTVVERDRTVYRLWCFVRRRIIRCTETF